jgi:xanthine dehydrogenase YagS FAD-binding subunit
MRSFKHINARTADEASALLRKYKGKAMLNAGGTDLLSILKGEYLTDYPDAVINIKTIPGLDYIKEEGSVLKIGALTKLSDIAKSPLLKSSTKALVEAVRSYSPGPQHGHHWGESVSGCALLVLQISGPHRRTYCVPA